MLGLSLAVTTPDPLAGLRLPNLPTNEAWVYAVDADGKLQLVTFTDVDGKTRPTKSEQA